MPERFWPDGAPRRGGLEDVMPNANESRHVIDAGRRIAVRQFCLDQIKHDAGKAGDGLTDRAWCAQGVLNILDGLIDEQLGF